MSKKNIIQSKKIPWWKKMVNFLFSNWTVGYDQKRGLNAEKKVKF